MEIAPNPCRRLVDASAPARHVICLHGEAVPGDCAEAPPERSGVDPASRSSPLPTKASGLLVEAVGAPLTRRFMRLTGQKSASPPASPGGHVDPADEDSREAAARELPEETGVRVEPERLRLVGDGGGALPPHGLRAGGEGGAGDLVTGGLQTDGGREATRGVAQRLVDHLPGAHGGERLEHPGAQGGFLEDVDEGDGAPLLADRLLEFAQVLAFPLWLGLLSRLLYLLPLAVLRRMAARPRRCPALGRRLVPPGNPELPTALRELSPLVDIEV
ncbi:NUDIX hydrolase [Streptomyces alboniger]|uniref:NUDIX hydrolase n=3 Tax=Streptomyces alboniger TaxID=132473 RepID=A0A5J6HSQ7_STRAD|nr:NUDIX hydrolase [Streptomyces alboniger]